MGQKVNPHGLRVGVIKDWDAQWFVDKKDYFTLRILEKIEKQFPYEDCRLFKIKLFENLEYTSNKSIDSMVAGLENMKGALKGQDSEVLEQILNKLQELRKIQ